MGEYADLAIEENEIDQLYGFYEKIPVKKKFIWKTLDGRFINITDMKDSHLINAYNMLVRKKRGIHFQKAMAQEIKKRCLHVSHRTAANVRFGWITSLSQMILRITSYIRKR